jgi:hypothetical protein
LIHKQTMLRELVSHRDAQSYAQALS